MSLTLHIFTLFLQCVVRPMCHDQCCTLRYHLNSMGITGYFLSHTEQTYPEKKDTSYDMCTRDINMHISRRPGSRVDPSAVWVPGGCFRIVAPTVERTGADKCIGKDMYEVSLNRSKQGRMMPLTKILRVDTESKRTA